MNNLDTLVSGSSETLNMELFKTTDGALVSLGDNVTLQDMILGSMYENLELTTNDSMTAIILTGTARTENIFRDSSLTRNAATGADILWNSRYHMEEGSALRDFYTSVLLSQNSGDYSGAARKLAAAAGSTVTSLGIASATPCATRWAGYATAWRRWALTLHMSMKTCPTSICGCREPGLMPSWTPGGMKAATNSPPGEAR